METCPKCNHKLALGGWNMSGKALWQCCNCGWENYNGNIYDALKRR